MIEANFNSKMVAFYPQGILAPVELLAVRVPVGKVTYPIWIKALSDRILDMLDEEANPEESATWACNALKCPNCIEPNQLGQFIVEGNWNLLEQIKCSILVDDDPFSGYPTDDDLEALEAIKNTDLESWVNYAADMMEL